MADLTPTVSKTPISGTACVSIEADGAHKPDGYSALYFTGFDPAIAEGIQAQYATADVVGRAESYLTYTGTANRELSLSLECHAQTPQEMSDMYDAVRILQSLCEPIPGDKGFDYAPPPVIVTVGRLLTMRAVVESVTPTWGPNYDENLRPIGCTIAIQFKCVRKVSASNSSGTSAKGVFVAF